MARPPAAPVSDFELAPGAVGTGNHEQIAGALALVFKVRRYFFWGMAGFSVAATLWRIPNQTPFINFIVTDH
jgi:hypothetical protein